MEYETLCVHAVSQKNAEGAIATPIFQSATFVHEGVNVSSPYSYTRLSNPTRTHLEQTVATLEGGAAAFAFSSGMAAISAVMKLFGMSDHIIATDDLYGGSLRLFRNMNTAEGMQFDFTDTGDLAKVQSLIRKNTKAIYVETPSNPTMRVTDIAAIAEIAHRHGLLCIVDNTFLTSYYQKPLALGADIVIYSGTKYLGGHNDTLAGFAVAKTPALAEKIAYIYKTVGAALSPFDSFLIERGLKTLPLRMDKISANAQAIAAWLRQRKDVKKVYYIGFADHDGSAVSARQATGFGGMISFEVTSRALTENILSKVKVLQYAESLGGVESLITYPMRQTHADVPKADRLRRGINDRFLRISAGIENETDLIKDLEQAFIL